MADKDLNKRAVENFIKAGALDSLGGTRKQFMSIYVQIMDRIVKDKKNNMAGQMTLFDIATAEDRDDFDIKMPDVGEYNKEMLLGFEKEVLGIYISGHPMEEYQQLWERLKSNSTTDFMLDEETGSAQVEDQTNVIIGGMIADKNIKYTRNDKVMAFLTVEDLVGSVEVVVFPKDYEKYSALLSEDAKIFVRGRASLEEDKDGKVICEQIVSFEEAMQGGNPFRRRFDSPQSYGGSHGGYQRSQSNNTHTQTAGNEAGKLPRGVWIQFEDLASYQAAEKQVLEAIADSDGTDNVVIFIRNPKSWKVLPPNLAVNADSRLAERLYAVFGKENVKFLT
jgi:DNA polymerase-3 subunit alpha